MNQSDFKPGDSCINQLLSITHGTCVTFDEVYEGSGVFCDTSKAFDKVWFGMKVSSLSYSEMEYPTNCYVS